MGCDYYHILNMEDDDWGLHFSESDDSEEDWSCLCTFPSNDGDNLSIERLQSLALLGAAVVLAHDGLLNSPFLPFCVPGWIRDEIKKLNKS